MSVKQSFTICASISSDQISSMDDDIDSSTEKHKWVATDLLEKKILKEVLPHQYLEDENDEDNEHHFLNGENSMRSESGALTYLYLDGIFSSHFPPYVPDHVIRLIENSRKGDVTHARTLIDFMKDNDVRFSIENLKQIAAKFIKTEMSWECITSFFKFIFCLVIFARENGDFILHKNIPQMILHFLDAIKNWILNNQGWTAYM